MIRRRVKLDEKLFQLEAFNLCDPEATRQALLPFMEYVNVRDLSGYYTNNKETLVVKLKSSKDVKTSAELALAMNSVGAQEINVKHAHNGVYMRFWWD